MQSFPEIRVSPVINEEDEGEDVDSILSFKTLSYTFFKDASKKAIYYTLVKVIHRELLKRQRTSRWPGLLRPDFLVRDRWRTLYKPPVEKRTADLQWRIIHGAIATDGHVAHLNPAVEGKCRFCGEQEDIEHLFLRCSRLQGLFNLLKALFSNFNENFLIKCLLGNEIYFLVRRKMCLLNYLIGTAKLAIWKQERIKVYSLLQWTLKLCFNAW